MELLELYKEENKDILYSMSWLNKNSIFDKSIGGFQDIDLFTFLENINQFDYTKNIFYDDVYYILEYTEDTILHIIKNINREIKRKHRVMPISQAKEFDRESILWLSKKNGRTIKEKLSNGKIKAVDRYSNIDTYENRIFKILLKKLVLIYEKRDDLTKFYTLFIKIRKWLRSDESKSIDEYKKIVYNNILLHHKHYNKIFKSYKWLNRLDDKLKFYSTSYIQQLQTIIKFEVLYQLQFYTEVPILAKNLNIDRAKYSVDIINPLIEQNLDKLLESTYKRFFKKDPKNSFLDIRQFIKSELKSVMVNSRIFKIDIKENNQIFIDLFRLFPIAKIDMQITNFPITLLQDIDGTIINANNTKVIDLNHEIHTLPEILKTYNTSILRIFLDNFEKYFKDKQLNYIIPDYVNIFEFSSVKKTINSYFPNSRNIPKSILAGLQYLFDDNLQKNDTLIYIQKNHDNDLYVTPLLVKYDESLQSITNGLYLEKHPTKKLRSSDDILKSLNDVFTKNTSIKLVNKFLQNGIKGIKKGKIVFYQNEKLIDLKNFQFPNFERTQLTTVKEKFHSKKLFQRKNIFINDDKIQNLHNFEKLLQYEKDNYKLWKEHLPRLAMGNMPMNGYFGEFVLVDEDSKVTEDIIEIKNHFSIPANVSELSFPLIFGEENINFEAYITSNQLPFKEDVECELELRYNYEDETPYKLTFIPLDKKYKPLNVKWREIQHKECNNLPIPSYSPKKSWEDFKKDPKRDGSGYSNLLEWIVERLELLNNIEEIPNFILEKEIKRNTKLTGYYKWGKENDNGNFFCFVEVNGVDIYCNSSNFKENISINEFYEGKKIFLKINNNHDKPYGYDITFTEIPMNQLIENIKSNYRNQPLERKIKQQTDKLIKALKSIRYPLLTIWNSNSLQDIDAPNDFRIKILEAIQLAIKILELENIEDNLRYELEFFLAALHKDTQPIIIDNLLKYSKSLDKSAILAYSVGDMSLQWQQEIVSHIWDNIRKGNKVPIAMTIFSTIAWRDEKFIINLKKKDFQFLIEKLSVLLEKDIYKIKYYNEYTDRIEANPYLLRKLELLFALLRFRKKQTNILCFNDKSTKHFLNNINFIMKTVINEKLYFNARIQLNIDKPDGFKNTPDLLYALRMYLSGNIEATQSIKVLGVSDD